jgi:hypothetical protein
MTDCGYHSPHRPFLLVALFIAGAFGSGQHALAQRDGALAETTSQQPMPPGAAPRVTVTLRLVGTHLDGATGHPEALVSGGLAAGQPGTLVVVSGSTDDLCAAIGAGGPSPQARYVWQVEAEPVSVDDETIVVAVDWKRSDQTADGGREVRAGGRRTITLKSGERHVLDFVSAPPNARSGCASLMVQVEASLADDPAFAGASLGYDVWLVNQDAAGREMTRHLQTIAGQNETVPLRFLPLGWASDGSAPADPWSPGVSLSITGTVRGRLQPDGRIQMVVSASRNVKSGAAEGETGWGEKRFTVRPGEIVRIEVPQSSGGLVPFLAGHRTFLTIVAHVR